MAVSFLIKTEEGQVLFGAIMAAYIIKQRTAEVRGCFIAINASGNTAIPD